MTIAAPSNENDGAPPAELKHISVEGRVSELLRIGIIAAFAYWSAQIVAPFALICVWAAILTVALYPVFDFLSRLLGGRPVLAAIILVAACLLVIISPLALAASDLVRTVQSFFADGSDFQIPQAPERLNDLPVIGTYLYSAWNSAASNLADAIVSFQAPLRQAGGTILAKALSIGGGILSFVASVLLCGFFLTIAPRLSSAIQLLADRIAGDRGVGFAKLAGTTVRNVSRGVIGVALFQTLLCGLLFAAFGVPARGALTYGIFVLCLIQIGPGLILLPVIAWAWFSWPFDTSLLFTAITIPIVLIDNILKPILISRGLSTPIPVILLGVIGGTISYGLVGLFIGPIILGVFYDLLVAWASTPASHSKIAPRPSEVEGPQAGASPS
ncbi:Predicted PurR-regulated permease PerM [Rhizobium sp. NFR07]|uniref:AI-2E family transporter n=1 Tax=Rhizobium sp. NFR07 TaxID=1566262 RepID=UPI0008F13252|nr:AI-2E family transporter [Rhizobium sp. NFR07]SFA81953.1 Predicted PurR-regulated permease PerM [Rhizobium sp. NFR07]